MSPHADKVTGVFRSLGLAVVLAVMPFFAHGQMFGSSEAADLHAIRGINQDTHNLLIWFQSLTDARPALGGNWGFWGPHQSLRSIAPIRYYADGVTGDGDLPTLYGLIAGWDFNGLTQAHGIMTNGLLGQMYRISSDTHDINSNLFTIGEHVLTMETDVHEMLERQRFHQDEVQDALFEGTVSTNSSGRTPYLQTIEESLIEPETPQVGTTNLFQYVKAIAEKSHNQATTNDLSGITNTLIAIQTWLSTNNFLSITPHVASNIIAALFPGPDSGSAILENLEDYDADEFREDYNLGAIIGLLVASGVPSSPSTEPFMTKLYNHFNQDYNGWEYGRWRNYIRNLIPEGTGDRDHLLNMIDYVTKMHFLQYGTLEIRSLLEGIVPIVSNQVEKSEFGFYSTNVLERLETIISNIASPTYIVITNDIDIPIPDTEDVPSVDEPTPDDFTEYSLTEHPDEGYKSRLDDLTEDSGGYLDKFQKPAVSYEEMNDTVAHIIEQVMQDSGAQKTLSYEIGFVGNSELDPLHVTLNFELPQNAKRKVDAFWNLILAATKLTINAVLFMMIFRAFYGETVSGEFNRYFDDL